MPSLSNYCHWQGFVCFVQTVLLLLELCHNVDANYAKDWSINLKLLTVISLIERVKLPVQFTM